ncbi:MAG: 2Fe-2S iron-sulfur cluster binding domain-containing protein [Aquabacterium sp.]|nr:2Fe-2S iron-sulfur cluster binding domain-containing protein [Aquabacterium sp.]
MFSFLAKKKPTTARINDVAITVHPKETLLQAALREGIDFPHSCRVGGCASCKCKLVEGKVKELTKAAYVLSDDELDQGYILACQSVPQSDVSIQVDMSSQQAMRRVTGKVIGQDKLTHDITRLRVQLDESLPYKAGQFANISVGAQSDISRSYSFATPPQPDSKVSFFVRKIPGGVFSSLINDQSVIGQPVSVEGPAGDFWLRPADAPLLLIAGGSGLAPVVALLQEALNAGVSRPVTLLFGAREERDLYALDVIDQIASKWQGKFVFMPVLSAAADDAPWRGERGLVSDKIPALLEPGSHAYLCGPPVMIDICTALLRDNGIQREHIHADRFTTLHDTMAVVA